MNFGKLQITTKPTPDGEASHFHVAHNGLVSGPLLPDEVLWTVACALMGQTATWMRTQEEPDREDQAFLDRCKKHEENQNTP